jgi:integrase/recombinase XerD
MEACEQTRFESLYAQHLRALKLQGKAAATADSYARAVRRVAAYFDRCPDQLSTEDFKNYFASLIDTRSWSLVKIERSGLQFFYKHVLGQAWLWVDMVKAPVVKALPDVLSLEEIARIVVGTRERRYQTFCLPWQTNQQKRGGQPTAWGCV